MKIVERFEAAVRKHEMRGAGRPEDRSDVEEEYKEAKKELLSKLREHNRIIAQAH